MPTGSVVITLVIVAASSACAHPASRVPASTQPHADTTQTGLQTWAYRPRHKGAIDISMGLYIRQDDDLFLNTAIPVVLRRTYESGDHHLRRFGMSTTHPGEWWLYGDGNPRIPWAVLIREDGSKIHFTRISPGDTQDGAVLRADPSLTEFDGALMSWDGSRWEVRLDDGMVASFLDCQGEHDVCSLVERRDAQGHRVEYVRDTSGRLLRMESEGQAIAFEYGDPKRIIRAYDTSGRSMSYTYDDRGRLVRATSSDGTIRTYAYDANDQLIAIREPGRIVENWFDNSGRVVRQEVRSSDDDDDPYVATVRYMVEGESIVQVDFDEGDGIERSRFNSEHYIVSQTFDADGAAPVTFTYNRDVSTNAVSSATMSCFGLSGPTTRSVPVAATGDDDVKYALIRENCLRPRY